MDVLDPAALTGVRPGLIAWCAEDARHYLVARDGAVPVSGGRLLTQVDPAALIPAGADHATALNGRVVLARPVTPVGVGSAALEGRLQGVAVGGQVCVETGVGMPQAVAAPSFDWTRGPELLDERISFSRASVATRVNAQGLIETVGNNVPRFDYDPVTLEPRGLLIEETRTNLLLSSGDQTASSWDFPGGMRTRSVRAPDGGFATVYRGPWTGVPRTSVIGVPSAVVTASIFAKWVDGQATRLFLLRNNTTLADFTIGQVNLKTGVVIGSGWEVEPWPDGWWRISYTQSTGISVGDNLAFYVGNTGIGVDSGAWALWGAQLEAGSYATSYIPTGASAVTRAAENAVISGAAFDAWFNPDEGSLFAEFIAASTEPSTGVGQYVANIGFDVANRVLTMGRIGGAGAVIQSRLATANLLIVTGAHANDAIGRYAARYRDNDFAGSINGGATVVSPSGSVPRGAGMRLAIGNAVGTSFYVNGPIQRIHYAPRGLSDAELQALTA